MGERWQSTIEDAEAHMTGDGRAQIEWWVIRPDGRREKHFTRMGVKDGIEMTTPTGRLTKDWREVTQKLRRRAEDRLGRIQEKAEQEEASGAGVRIWRREDRAAEYVREVSIPSMLANPDLRDSTKRRYLYLLRELQASVGTMTLGALLLPRASGKLLKEIEDGHGSTAASGVASMLSQYVYGEMVVDRIIQQNENPMLIKQNRFRPHGVNKGTARRSDAQRAGGEDLGEVRVVSPEERARVVRWLLDDEFASRQYGRLTVAQHRYLHQALVDLTLAQATMGLRFGECLTLTAGRVERDSDGLAVVEVTPSHSKTKRGRKVGTFDPEFGPVVSERLLARCEGLASADHVFASAMTGGYWCPENARKPLRRLYDRMADECDVPLLRERFTHVWRASLNTEYADLYAKGLSGMDEATRTGLFGHSADVERTYYTADVTPEQQRARAARRVVVAGDREGGAPAEALTLMKSA